MARLLPWWFVLVIVLTMSLDCPLVFRQHTLLFVRAQDVGTDEGTVTPNSTAPANTSAPTEQPTSTPQATTSTPTAPTDTSAPTATSVDPPTSAPQVTTATPKTTSPIATEGATVPVPTTTVPVAPAPEVTTTPTSTEAVTIAPVPVATTPVVTQKPTPSSAADALGTAAATSNLRGDNGSSASSTKQASKGTLSGGSTAKTIVVCAVGGFGVAIIFALLLLLCLRRSREDKDPDTSSATSIAFPNDNSVASIVGAAATATAQDYSAWKTSGSSLASRDFPLPESTCAKLNATARSSTEYDLSERPSQIADISSRGSPSTPIQEHRETNTSSEQSFSIRGYSEFSALHGGDSEASAISFDRYSTASSRLSSEPGRSTNGITKSLDMHRFSSTSSRPSSVVARKHQPVSFINRDLTEPPSLEAATPTESTSSRADVPDWYSAIESPTDNDRYTGERYTVSSLENNDISDESSSFEL